jgi:hypothetical protein
VANTILGILYGLLLFTMTFWAYRRGLKDGMNLVKGKEPEPVKTIFNTPVKEEPKLSPIIEGFQNIMNYNGDPQGGEGK